MRVTLFRSGNRIIVDPTTPEISSLLLPRLRYSELKIYRGKEKYERKNLGLSTVEEVDWECFARDHRDRIVTSFGFKNRLVKTLKEAGYSPVVRFGTEAEATEHAERLASVFTPRWDRLEDFIARTGFKYRYMQKTAVQLIGQYENGRISCPPGWGKGTIITLAAILFPRAKIEIITDRCDVLRGRLYPELLLALPSVGIIGCGMNHRGYRIMCVNADSLHHARTDADIVFVDEGHESCADTYAAKLAAYKTTRMWSFSASWDMRMDNKDMRAEAMYGPIRLEVPYADAVVGNTVVPIEVYWHDVIMDINPCFEVKDDVERKRLGLWSNQRRNEIIRDIARRYDASTQVLIPVETMEHALYLKRLLPEYKVVYADRPLKFKDLQRWREYGLIDETFAEMTTERRMRLTRMFGAGQIKKVIATTVWNVGVDFKHLEVVIRADGGGSRINDTQIPGRVSRKNAALIKNGRTVEKLKGIVHDFRDQFDSRFGSRAKRRGDSYTAQGWKQHFLKPSDYSKLAQAMGWTGGRPLRK